VQAVFYEVFTTDHSRRDDRHRVQVLQKYFGQDSEVSILLSVRGSCIMHVLSQMNNVMRISLLLSRHAFSIKYALSVSISVYCVFCVKNCTQVA